MTIQSPRNEKTDPRPPEFRRTASSQLTTLLENIHDEQLCVSLLFDKSFQHWSTRNSKQQPVSYNLPNERDLKDTMSAFKESLQISEEKAREIESSTREQRLSPLWYSSRRNKIT